MRAVELLVSITCTEADPVRQGLNVNSRAENGGRHKRRWHRCSIKRDHILSYEIASGDGDVEDDMAGLKELQRVERSAGEGDGGRGWIDGGGVAGDHDLLETGVGLRADGHGDMLGVEEGDGTACR